MDFQAVVLLGPLALNSGDPGRVDVLIPYVAATMRTAQQLGLDKLGSDPNTMPSVQDPALPPGPSSLRREIALRAFHSLCHIDQTTFRCRPVLPMHLGETHSACYSPSSTWVDPFVLPVPVDCAFPGNYNDQDLTPDVLSPAAPPNVRTISAYEVRPTCPFSIACLGERAHDRSYLSSPDTPFSSRHDPTSFP